MSAQDYENKNVGGFVNPKHSTPRIQKMKWTAEADRRLLLIGLGKEISPKEYKIIAESFKEKPTPKAIQERLTKLRQEQMEVLEKFGLIKPSTTIHPANNDDQESSLATTKTEPFRDEDAANVLLSLRSGEIFTPAAPKNNPIDLTTTATTATTATDDSPTVTGSMPAKKRQKKKQKTSGGANPGFSNIPDPDDELLPLSALRPGLVTETEEEKRTRKHQEARRNYAKQKAREEAEEEEKERQEE